MARLVSAWAAVSWTAVVVACGAPGPPAADRATEGGRAGAPAAESMRPRDGEARSSGAAATSAIGNRDTDPCPRWDQIDVAHLAPLPSSPYAAVLEQVWRVVWSRHFDPTFACVNWPRLREDYGARLAGATTTTEAYARINEMLGRLGVSHLRAFAPYDLTHPSPGGTGWVPLRARWIEGAVVVTHTSLFGQGSGIARGTVLHQIDARPVAPTEGGQARAGGRRQRREVAVASHLDELLRCEPGRRRRFKLSEPGEPGRVQTRELVCVAPLGRVINFGHLRGLRARVESRMLDGKIGYLAFNVWMLPLAADLHRALGELRKAGARALILDLRGNLGGVGGMTIPVASLFMGERADLGRLVMRGVTQKLEVRPGPGDDPFLGPLALLVDERTASTSEIFAIAMGQQGRAKIYGGVPTAGMALPSLVERLPDGGLLQYPVGEYFGPGGAVAEGVGVRPDVVVARRRSDYVAGRDPVLEAAVRDLQLGQATEK
ncbi:MAG: S41 family peptidase [Nannocystaceae bacterium]